MALSLLIICHHLMLAMKNRLYVFQVCSYIKHSLPSVFDLLNYAAFKLLSYLH